MGSERGYWFLWGIALVLSRKKADGMHTIGVPSVPFSGSAISTLSLNIRCTGLAEVMNLLIDTQIGRMMRIFQTCLIVGYGEEVEEVRLQDNWTFKGAFAQLRTIIFVLLAITTMYLQRERRLLLEASRL